MRIVLWFLSTLRPSRRFLYIPLVAGTLAAILLLSACGGGGSSSSPPPPPPPPPDFSLAFEEASVSLQPQGVSQGQAISATPANGFTGTIDLTVSGLPAGVTMTPGSLPALVITGSGTGASFQLAASPSATVGTSTVTVTGTSGSISHSKTFSLAVTAAAPFTIQASPTALALTPSLNGTVQVTVTPSPGTSPSLGIQVTQAPPNSGINIWGPQSLLTPTNPVQILVEAGVLAQPVQNLPIVVTATDDSNNSYVVVVPLTISVASFSVTPTRSTFARTDCGPTGVVYDEARKLLFVSVEVLNQVAVLSSVDGHRMATIPVQYPAGIDESADGSAVYVVSPYFSYITTIDPNLLEVVQQTNIPQTPSGQNAFAFQLVTLSNGDVLFLPNQAPTGPLAYLWNPATNVFTALNQQALQNLSLITRSADHSKALIYGADSSGATTVVYDAASGNLTGPVRLSGVGSLAMSPNGSEIVGLGNDAVFYDNRFNVIGSVSLDSQADVGALYSLDGNHAYVLETDMFSGDNVAAVIDTSTFSLVGVVPSFAFGSALPFSGPVNVAFAIDETNMMFGPAFQGVGYLDVASPGFFNLPFSNGSLMSPTLESLTGTTATQLQGAYFSSAWSYNVYFGPPPASPHAQPGTNLSVQSTNILDVTAPAGADAGPANVTLTRSDGFFQVMPNGVSYGPTVLQVDANAGSPTGGDSIKVDGYGFDTSNLQVTIGGKPATNISRNGPIGGGLFPTARLALTTPAGASGYADVTVTTPDGSTTVSNGFQYLSSTQIHPASGSAFDDIVYDQTRQRLYITNQNHNRVEIFDLGTLTFLSPIPVGNQPTALALTPDGVKVGVINSTDETMSVIDPAALQVLTTFTVVPAQDTGCNAPLNMSPVEPHRMLLSLACIGGGDIFHLVDLDTGSLSCTGVAGCESNGTDMAFGSCNSGVGPTASIPDGSKVFLAGEVAVAMLDLNANTVTCGFAGTFNDAAASADGNVFAASFGISNAQLSRSAIMAFEPYADSGNQSILPPGEKLNPSGSLLFVPQSAAVAIFDVHTGRMVQRVAISDGIPQDTGAMALDETGTKMFLITNSGITIAQLAQAPLSLASANPAAGPPGTQVTLRGSGFLNGASILFGTSQAATTYVDTETLIATVPAMSAAPVRISVKNPSGQTYSFDDAFTVR